MAVEQFVTDLTQCRGTVTLQRDLHRVAACGSECRHQARPRLDGHILRIQRPIDVGTAILIGHGDY